MRREFILNLIIVIGANLLVKPIYIFGIDRTVQNVVGPESYGTFFALFNFALLFQFITDLGLQNYNNKTISQKPNLAGSYFPSIILLKTGLALAFIVVLFVSAKIIGYDHVQTQLLIWIGFNTILVALILYLRSNISGLGYYRLDSILSVLDKVLMILIIGYSLWTQEQFSIYTFIQGQTVALSISSIIIGAIAVGKVRKLQWPSSIREPMHILKASIPYALVIVLMTIYTRIDSVMIERMLPDGALEAGIYASGYRFFDAANMLGYLIAGLLLPMFAKMLAKGNNVFPLFHLSLYGSVIIAFFLSACSFVFRAELVELLYQHSNAYWGEVLGCLMLSFVFVMAGYITGSLLTANESIQKLSWIFLISIGLNIILNILLIKGFKAYGAALATLFTQGFVTLAQIYFVNRYMQFSFQRYPIASWIFAGLLILLSLVLIRNIGQTNLHYLLGIIVIGCIITIHLIVYTRKEIALEDIDMLND